LRLIKNSEAPRAPALRGRIVDATFQVTNLVLS
jgi:hypothetical protein